MLSTFTLLTRVNYFVVDGLRWNLGTAHAALYKYCRTGPPKTGVVVRKIAAPDTLLICFCGQVSIINCGRRAQKCVMKYLCACCALHRHISTSRPHPKYILACRTLVHSAHTKKRNGGRSRVPNLIAYYTQLSCDRKLSRLLPHIRERGGGQLLNITTASSRVRIRCTYLKAIN